MDQIKSRQKRRRTSWTSSLNKKTGKLQIKQISRGELFAKWRVKGPPLHHLHPQKENTAELGNSAEKSTTAPLNEIRCQSKEVGGVSENVVPDIDECQLNRAVSQHTDSNFPEQIDSSKAYDQQELILSKDYPLNQRTHRSIGGTFGGNVSKGSRRSNKLHKIYNVKVRPREQIVRLLATAREMHQGALATHTPIVVLERLPKDFEKLIPKLISASFENQALKVKAVPSQICTHVEDNKDGNPPEVATLEKPKIGSAGKLYNIKTRRPHERKPLKHKDYVSYGFKTLGGKKKMSLSTSDSKASKGKSFDLVFSLFFL